MRRVAEHPTHFIQAGQALLPLFPHVLAMYLSMTKLSKSLELLSAGHDTSEQLGSYY